MKENITSRCLTDLTPNQFPSYSTPDIFQNLKPENVFFCFVFPVHRVTGRDDVKDHVTFSVVCGWLQNEYIRRRKFGFRYFWHLRSLFTSLVTSPWVFCCLLLRHEVHTPSSSLLRGCLCSRCAGEWRSSNLIIFFSIFSGFSWKENYWSNKCLPMDLCDLLQKTE